MNTRIVVLAIVTLSGAAYADTTRSTSKPTSLGTSKVRTPGGTNIVKANVLSNSSLPAARDISAAVYSSGVANLLTTGYKVTLPAQLGDQAQILPWKAGEPRIITAKTGTEIAARLTNIMTQAKKLFDKGEITDQQLATVNSLNTMVTTFNATSQVLAKHNVAVSMDP